MSCSTNTMFNASGFDPHSKVAKFEELDIQVKLSNVKP